MLNHPQIVLKDLKKLAQNTDGIILEDATTMSEVKVSFTGPDETPYATGVFRLKICIPNEYPFRPPQVKFITKMFHPNISRSGKVCMDRLAEEWKPTITLKHICEMTRSLLQDPNPTSPLNDDAARMMTRDYEMYQRTVLMWVKHHANGIHSYPPYQELAEVLSALTGDLDHALHLLTVCCWDSQAASDRLL